MNVDPWTMAILVDRAGRHSRSAFRLAMLGHKAEAVDAASAALEAAEAAASAGGGLRAVEAVELAREAQAASWSARKVYRGSGRSMVCRDCGVEVATVGEPSAAHIAGATRIVPTGAWGSYHPAVGAFCLAHAERVKDAPAERLRSGLVLESQTRPDAVSWPWYIAGGGWHPQGADGRPLNASGCPCGGVGLAPLDRTGLERCAECGRVLR